MINNQTMYENLKRCIEADISNPKAFVTFNFVLGMISALEDTKQVIPVGTDTKEILKRLKKQ